VRRLTRSGLRGHTPLGTDMVSALDEQFAMTRLARDRGWDAVASLRASPRSRSARARIVAELLATLEPDVPTQKHDEAHWLREIEPARLSSEAVEELFEAARVVPRPAAAP
jgi:hypothetical protein